MIGTGGSGRQRTMRITTIEPGWWYRRRVGHVSGCALMRLIAAVVSLSTISFYDQTVVYHGTETFTT